MRIPSATRRVLSGCSHSRCSSHESHLTLCHQPPYLGGTSAPDRACFTAALAAARDTATRAADILPAAGSELTSAVTETVAATLLPPRRARISARAVKGVSARYGHRKPGEKRPRASSPVTAIGIVIHAPADGDVTPVPAAPVPLRAAHPDETIPTPTNPPADAATLLPPTVPMHTSRLDDVLAAMGTAPEREWRVTELTTLLRLDRGDLTGELIRWARREILIKTGPATFKIPEGPPRPSRLAVRQQDVLAIMATDPDRDWCTRELATTLNTVKERTLAYHLNTWVRKNLLVKTAPATYRLPKQTAPAPLTQPPATTNTPTGKAA
ncbi:hypothetical protein WJ438_07625 [Streptomyces sp. GD-15H]|uniref:hypothetical protein n=1 Tax=Streptomyces sp. GD-15H TaxID=3129112 RepID=UPI0032516DE3